MENSGINYTNDEIKIFKRLNSPQKIQDYLNSLLVDFEESTDSYLSPRQILKYKKANCMSGALFAAAALEFHGHEPLVLDLRPEKKSKDDDHVIAVFKKFDCFGAISKTNHAVLRYREPVYKTIRELVMSFFHEYFLNNGRKTLREYSELFNLSKLKINWRTSEKNLFQIEKLLDKSKHHFVLSKNQIKNLRKAEKIEIKAGKLTEYPREAIS